jgi:thioredoxin reductase
VLARARRRVAVVDAAQPRNAPATHTQVFLGSDGLPPSELAARGGEEVAGYGGNLTSGTARQITACPPAPHRRRQFQVVLADGSTLTARRVLVTTGLRDDVLDIPGVRERWGRDLLHCPYCHGSRSATNPWASSPAPRPPLATSSRTRS